MLMTTPATTHQAYHVERPDDHHPWTSPVPATVKGIIHVPAHNTPMKPSRREALLIAITMARKWVDDLAHGRAASFAAIARREVERHIRLLAPLAFVSPRRFWLLKISESAGLDRFVPLCQHCFMGGGGIDDQGSAHRTYFCAELASPPSRCGERHQRNSR
jgi:hypothetical protein